MTTKAEYKSGQQVIWNGRRYGVVVQYPMSRLVKISGLGLAVSETVDPGELFDDMDAWKVAQGLAIESAPTPDDEDDKETAAGDGDDDEADTQPIEKPTLADLLANGAVHLGMPVSVPVQAAETPPTADPVTVAQTVSDEAQIAAFDYGALNVEARIVVQQKTSEIREQIETMKRSAIAIGLRLIEIKAHLDYGQWGRWLEAEFGWSDQSALNYMNAARLAGKIPNYLESEDRFTQTAVTALAAKSVPVSAQKKAVQVAAALPEGKKLTHKQAKVIIAESKAAEPAPPVVTETGALVDGDGVIINREIPALKSDAETSTSSNFSIYDVLLIDPPWEFKVWSKDTGLGRSAESHYGTMTLDDLKALPMHRLMKADCAVFLWATWPTLKEAIELGEAWGLTYKTCAFNWVKMNKQQTDKPFTGMGYWTRANSEPCLLFTQGSPKRQDKGVPQILLDWTDGFDTETVATPIGEHSEKPDAIFQRIEDLIDGDYCEVFARRERMCWATIGNEIDSRDIREVLADYAPQNN